MYPRFAQRWLRSTRNISNVYKYDYKILNDNCSRIQTKVYQNRSFFCSSTNSSITSSNPASEVQEEDNDLESIIIENHKKISNSGTDFFDESFGDIGEEITGRKLEKAEIQKLLSKFIQRSTVRHLADEHGLKPKLLVEAFGSFRKQIFDSKILNPELHIIFSDILENKGHVDDLFPYFLKHAKQIFPHIDCLDDLKKISDLRLPPNWYPMARQFNRKFIFHCGPTNSGKTWNALNRFLQSESGIYCGPLKMLATEVFQKANEAGVKCDLVTGEERRYANANEEPSAHVSCTVEMCSVNKDYEVAVIDEIQMMRDPERGWAWTRALLGLAAKEIHLCGEKAAVNLVMELLGSTGETVEIREYNRLTKLKIEDQGLDSLKNVQPGDAIVCFSKKDIYNVSLSLEKMGFNVATIYGTLPPSTKLLQTKKFNDPNDPCNVLVATDAIGMGLNLCIRRVVFYSLTKPIFNEKMEKKIDVIPASQALQIAGRAGRFGTQYEEGYCTTFKSEELPVLKKVLSSPIENISAAGLHPTVDQIEMFSFLLPNASLSNILEIFVSLCQLNRRYFMCNIETIKFLADIVEHIRLPLRARYIFCCAPVPTKSNYVCAMFLKYARQFSNNQPMSVNWLCHTMKFPWKRPENIAELDQLLNIYDCLDLYLWLSYRFPDVFFDQDLVRGIQRKLDKVILEGVLNITKLIKNSNISIGDKKIFTR